MLRAFVTRQGRGTRTAPPQPLTTADSVQLVLNLKQVLEIIRWCNSISVSKHSLILISRSQQDQTKGRRRSPGNWLLHKGSVKTDPKADKVEIGSRAKPRGGDAGRQCNGWLQWMAYVIRIKAATKIWGRQGIRIQFVKHYVPKAWTHGAAQLWVKKGPMQ